MPAILGAHKLHHSFGGQKLFEGLTFSIHTGEKVAIVGANGAGKSTLFQIMGGWLKPDEGSVTQEKGLHIGLLPQVPKLPGTISLREYLYGTMERDAHETGEWEKYASMDEILEPLGLSEKDGKNSRLNLPLQSLSGGWQKKAALAYQLVRRPDLILLDEPTNHLDLSSVLWLESFIQKSRAAVLLVSHDRTFLERTVNKYLEIDRRNPDGILVIDGNFQDYLRVKAEYLANLEAQSSALSNTLRREIEWVRRGAKARTTKQKARIDRATELGDKVSDLKSKLQNQSVELDFKTQDQRPKILIDAVDVSKRYGDHSLFKDLSIRVTANTRLGLLGDNGVGKTTLAKVLLGQIQPDQGSVRLHDQLEISYFEQKRQELDPAKSLLRNICPLGETVDYQGRQMHVRSYLDKFCFKTEQMDLIAGKLSGGEQSRLMIAKLMLNKANLLVLDEPTNDLDLATLDLLEDQLASFPGAVILVSHDRSFLDTVCTEVLYLPDQKTFADLAQWERWFLKQRGAVNTTSSSAKQRSGATEGTPIQSSAQSSARDRLSYKEVRELETMEAEILAKEEEVATYKRELETLNSKQQLKDIHKVTEALARLEIQIETMYARWAELERRRS